jgi:hypothetical protein
MSLDVYLYQSTDCQHCGLPIGATGSQLYSANVTHNLTIMAHEAGLYLVLWRP